MSELFIISGHFFLENIAKNKPDVYVTMAAKTWLYQLCLENFEIFPFPLWTTNKAVVRKPFVQHPQLL